MSESYVWEVLYMRDGTVIERVPEPHYAVPMAVDPRDPDPSREGIFRDHNCWKCHSGEKPCVVGNPRQCEYPRARND